MTTLANETSPMIMAAKPMPHSAAVFAGLLITPCARKSCTTGPMRGQVTILRYIFGDDFAKQTAAPSQNTVVGSPGTTIPSAPNANNT